MQSCARRTTPAIVAVMVAVGISGCSEPATSTAPAAHATTPGQAAGHLDPAEFDAAIHRPGTHVLDVRTPSEFASGHIAGAVGIDVEAADFRTRLGDLDHGTTYAVYCRTGGRSAAAVQAMASLGFISLFDLRGGITAWTHSGRVTVTSP